MKNKKLMICLCLTAVSLITAGVHINNTSQAAKPVIDRQNISKTNANYLETIKVVKNTATQIQNELQNLAALPNQIFSAAEQDLQNNLGNIQKSINGLLNPSSNGNTWANIFVDYPEYENVGGSVVDRLKADGNILHQLGLSSAGAYDISHENLKMIEKDSELIKNLMQLNQQADGNLKVEQVSNLIGAQRNSLESRKVQLQAIDTNINAQRFARETQLEAQALDIKNKHIKAEEKYKTGTDPLKAIIINKE